jgi:hypothetical protein
MRARRIEFLETKAIQSAYQIIPQRQSVRKEERTESVPLQIPQTTKLHVILNERSSKKRHENFQTPSDLRGVLNQIFATTKTYSTRAASLIEIIASKTTTKKGKCDSRVQA